MIEKNEKLKWRKTDKLAAHKTLVEPIVDALKEVLSNERNQLVERLNNLKRLGVIQVDSKKLNKTLEEMKF